MIPIILHLHELAALQAGQLSQIRRPVEPQPTRTEYDKDGGGQVRWPDGSSNWWDETMTPLAGFEDIGCPLGAPGDRLRVLEEWRTDRSGAWVPEIVFRDGRIAVPEFEQLDSFPRDWDSERWRPAETLPEWASRYHLDVVSVRVEQTDGEWWWVVGVKDVICGADESEEE